jgi:membrane protein DedA with SNARE-associated domain
MKRIAAIALFISALSWIILAGYAVFAGYADGESEIMVVIILTLILIFTGSAIHYTVVTKFGRESAIEHIEIEKQIIQLQIEKKELLIKIETLEKNG